MFVWISLARVQNYLMENFLHLSWPVIALIGVAIAARVNKILIAISLFVVPTFGLRFVMIDVEVSAATMFGLGAIAVPTGVLEVSPQVRFKSRVVFVDLWWILFPDSKRHFS